MKRKIGIYKIRNIINGKVYVGSSVNITKRWYDHKSNLRLNKSKSKKLQQAYIKYGEDNFLFEIIEECSKELLIEREQYWMDTNDSYKNGYNLRPKAENNLSIIGPNTGKIFSKEIREKMSESYKGKIPYNKLNLDLDLIKKLYIGDNLSAKNVSYILGCSQSVITKTLKENKLTKPYHIAHNDETRKISAKKLMGKPSGMLGKKHSEETRKKMKESAKKRNGG